LREWRNLADAPDLGSGGATHGGSSPPSRTSFRKISGEDGYNEEITVLNRFDSFAASKLRLLGSKFRVQPLLPNAPSCNADVQTICKSRRVSGVSIPVDTASTGFPTMEF
jgi:hypothetical protein